VTEQAALPYPEPDGTRTQGHSGSSTSRERAVREASSGTASARQKEALRYARLGGTYGLTVKELRDMTGWHHGQASSVLSVLHKEGKLERLTTRRDRCQVYVRPAYVMGRETVPHGGKAKVTYPFEEGGVIVIGPGAFMDKDKTVVNIDGVNYYRPEF
jgi:hypothetical protein